MKKILGICLLVVATSTALANDAVFSWATTSNGTLEANCRALWKEYDSLHDTVTTMMPGRGGLSGGLVVEDFLKSDKHNTVICIGMSQFFMNPLLYPGQTRENQLEPLAVVSQWPFILYVPAGVPATNYSEMIAYFRSLNRPINIGTFVPLFNVIGAVLRQQGIPVNIIPYTSGAQQYPSLADGTLDLAIDAGPGLAIAKQTKKFKPIGYIGPEHNFQIEGLKNIVPVEPDLRVIQAASMMVVAVKKSTPDAVKKQLAERLKKITESDAFKTSIAKFNSHPIGITGSMLTNSFDSNQQLVTKHWK